MGRAEEIYDRIRSDGVKAIEEFLETRASEELFLDFKRSSNDGSGRNLSDDDRRNYAKAISGFGNSEGGVLVWGIDCAPGKDGADVARSQRPLADAKRFESQLQGAISGSTVPAHRGVVNQSVLADKGPGGFVVTLIPSSNAAPHQAITKGLMDYYMRAGSDFVRVPHMILSGMFGRRPQPRVFHMLNVMPAYAPDNRIVRFALDLVIRNEGPGIATDLFATIFLKSFPGMDSRFQFKNITDPNWRGHWSYGRHLSIIANSDIRLPPEAFLQPISLTVELAAPFDKGVRIDGMVGARDTEPYRFTFQKSKGDLHAVYEAFIAKEKAGSITEQDRYRFASDALGIPDPKEK